MDDTPLGTQPSLDPIGREIARMKIGDALFAKIEEPPRAPVEPKRTFHWVVVVAIVAVIAAFVIASRW